mmetsp:Transcript_15792/g.21713  ORF Transcript_15792/g.21713 Transcript_15792/m.21713 type:complete len:133 (+) Transcript_15792:928-1326(+)
MLLNRGSSEDKVALGKLGVWSQDRFVSPLLTNEVFLSAKILPSPHKITLDETETIPYAQQIISAGLRDMTEEDFKDAHNNQDPVENAGRIQVGFQCWWVIRNVCISPQVTSQYVEHTGRGAKPVIWTLEYGN